MKTHFLLCFLILSDALGLCLIHFDNSDDSPLEYLYFQTGSCHMLEECCRDACCSLLAWDASTICLAPDFREVVHRIVDCSNVRYVPSIFTQPAQTLKKSGSAECVNNTVSNDKIASCQSGKNLLEKILPKGLKIQNSRILLSENVLNISTKDISHINNKLISPRYEEMHGDIVQPNRREFPQELKLRLQTHYKFLLLNSTIEEDPLKTNLSEIYETLKNSDVSRILVKLLQEKLKWLKEKEELSLNTFGEVVSEMTEPPPSIPKSSTKASKWDVVRQAFLKKHRFDISTPSQMTVPTKLKPEDSVLVHNEGKYHVAEKITNTIGSVDSSQEFKKFMNPFYAISALDFTPKPKENVKHQTDYYKAADYDTLEYFDVNLPYNIEQVGADTIPLENLSKATTEKFTKATLKSDTLFQEEKFELKETPSLKLNTNVKFSAPSTRKYANTKPNKSWKRILWPTNNESWKLSNKFKKMFVWRKQINNNSSRERKPIKLNEHFLLTLNSKNKSKEEPSEIFDSSRIDKNTKPPNAYDYPNYSSSIESASSESEDLYNNSIVFVVRERNTTGLKKDTRWRSILNFFHVLRVKILA